MTKMVEKTGDTFHYDAWCADFVRTMLEDTYGKKLPDWYKDIGKNDPNQSKSACVSVYDAAKKAHKTINIKDAKEGDLIFFDEAPYHEDGSPEMNHIGIVKKVENGRVYVIEGNSWDNNGNKSVVAENSYDIENPYGPGRNVRLYGCKMG